MLKLADIRKTTRRTSAGDLRSVHPRLLRDRSLAPRIEMTLRYMESMLGRPRRELDAEVVVQLFGDHKLARAIVACLASTYRHRARTFIEVLPEQHCAALARAGILTPSDLRLWVFRRVNAELRGFAGAAERASFLRTVAMELELPPDQMDTLLALDAPANAVLRRIGPRPTPEDVIARFNYETVAALLANAPLLRLSLRAAGDAPSIRALCDALDVRAEVAGRELVLHGRQDALNGWARHGTRLVRLLSTLLVCGLPARAGEATIAAPDGSEWLFRLDAEMLAYLSAAPAGDAPVAAADGLACWRRADAFAAEVAALRRSGSLDAGWALRRAAEPLVLDGVVLPTLFSLTMGASRILLAPPPATPAARDQFTRLSERLPLVVLDAAAEAESDSAASTAPEETAPSALRYARRGDAAALPDLIARAVARVERRAAGARVEALLAEVERAGVLTEPLLAERLGCAEEDVPAALERPSLRVASQRRGLRYVEGFGLCRADVLARAREAADDVTRLRGEQPVGQAWVLRQLGRRLRQVTGASEGIECLIAYLGAA